MKQTETYVHCGIDGWGYLFSIFDIFTREWIGYSFDLLTYCYPDSFIELLDYMRAYFHLRYRQTKGGGSCK
jgi:hypothetical protein